MIFRQLQIGVFLKSVVGSYFAKIICVCVWRERKRKGGGGESTAQASFFFYSFTTLPCYSITFFMLCT